MDNKFSNYNDATKALHAGQYIDVTTGASTTPIFQTSSYVFKSIADATKLYKGEKTGYLYTRISNPTIDAFEQRVALFEGGTAAVAVASGMAAIASTCIALTNIGDEIIAADNLYGGSYAFLKHSFEKLGRKTRFVKITDYGAFESNINDKTKGIYVEIIGNPRLEVADIDKIATIAHKYGVPLIVDNTIGVGLCKTFEFGADIEVISATKYIGGHGTTLGGVIVDSGHFNWNNGRFPSLCEPDPACYNTNFWQSYHAVAGVGNIVFASKVRSEILLNYGPVLSPFNAFQLLQGFETLPLRQQCHCKNALAVAEFLSSHPKVAWVNYPSLPTDPYYQTASKYLKYGGGGIVCFGLQGGVEVASKLVEKLKVFFHLANIGDSHSLIIHPASTTHLQLTPAEQLNVGITPEFIRLSIGLEDSQDIVADLAQGLAQV